MSLALSALLACRREPTDEAPPGHSGGTGPDTSATTVGTARTGETGGVTDTGRPFEASHTGGSSGTGDTAAPPNVLPACDIPWVVRAPLARTVPVDALRAAWMVGGDPTQPLLYVPSKVLTLADGSRQLAVGIQEKAVFFELPLTGEFTLTGGASAVMWQQGSVGEEWASADWIGDAGEDVLVAQGSTSETSVVSPPLAPRLHPLDGAASVHIDATATTGAVHYDVGDWNGDGRQDLLATWDYGQDVLGTRYPSLPYPLGGAAVYLAPLPPNLDLLASDPPAAWFDGAVLDWDAGIPHSGRHSLLVPDVDGDGRDDLLLAGSYWNSLAERVPPVSVPPAGVTPVDGGGFALFSGGVGGANVMGSERTLLASACGSDHWYWTELPTVPREVGDVDGDGFADVALLADSVDVPTGPTDVAFLVTRLPGLTGLHTYTEASGAVIVNVRGPSSLFQDAVSLGDLNGDGQGDLAIALWDRGVYVFLSPVSGFVDLETAALLITAPDSGGDFGASLTVGEVDGDGVDDLVISDPSHLVQYGAVHVVSGRRLRDELGLP